MSENMKLFEGLFKEEPYKIMKVKPLTTIVSLHDFEFAEIPNAVVDSVVKLLNGAYKEGIMSTLVQFKINLAELPKIEL